jgi:hypothetical protein
MTHEFTEERIAEAMARVEQVARRPGDHRCLPRPDAGARARATCTPKGRGKIGGARRVIVANAGRAAWDVWLDLHTGEGRLRRQRD